MKINRTISVCLLIGIILGSIVSVNAQLSFLKYYEAQHALVHVIQSLRSGKLEDMEDEYEQKCTTTNKCCICHKTFKNTSFLELHMNLHHPVPDRIPQHNLIPYIFDKRINNQLRFQTCNKFLTILDLNQLITKDHISAKNQSRDIKSSELFSKPLTKEEIVDTCTIIAYGAYHEPLWRFWIKCTLIFAFAVIFIVYYASVLDEINEKYFPKKNKQKNFRNR